MKQPTILIVGQGNIVSHLKSSLEKLRARIFTDRWSSRIPEEIDDETTAVLLVSPILETTVKKAVRDVRCGPQGDRVSIFAVLTDDSSIDRVRGIYAEGTTAVFDWPVESEILPFCVAEMIAADFVRGHAPNPDASLARLASAHIKARCNFNPDVSVRIVDGVAVISGSVSHLWQKEKIREVTSEIPGLLGVVSREVFIPPSEISDEEILENIKQMIRTVSQIDSKTISVRVENGRVTLAGSVSNRAELNRITGLLANVKGVRDIEKLAVVSESQNRRDGDVAKRLQERMYRLFVGEEVQVSFFGDTAVLSGKVSSLLKKNRIEEYLNDQSEVARVINKLAVAH